MIEEQPTSVLQSLFLIAIHDFGEKTGVRTEELWVVYWWLHLFLGLPFLSVCDYKPDQFVFK